MTTPASSDVDWRQVALAQNLVLDHLVSAAEQVVEDFDAYTSGGPPSSEFLEHWHALKAAIRTVTGRSHA